MRCNTATPCCAQSTARRRRLRQIIDSPTGTATIAAAHRNPTAAPAHRSTTTTNFQPEVRPAKMRSPSWTSAVGSRSRRRHHPSNAPYRQPPPPCLVINRSRDTIRSSSRSSSSSSSVGRRRNSRPPAKLSQPVGPATPADSHPQPAGRAGLARSPASRVPLESTIYNGRHRSFGPRLTGE